MSLDHWLYERISSMHGKSAVFDFIMLLFEIHLLRWVLFGLMLWIWLTRSNLQRGAVISLVAVAVSVVLRPVYKHVFDRERPWETYGCPELAPCYPDSSFPSAHLLLFAAMAIPLWRADRRLGWLLATMGLLIAASRIYLGEHWPSDLVMGALLGGALGLGLCWLAERNPFSYWISQVAALASRLRPSIPGLQPRIRAQELSAS